MVLRKTPSGNLSNSSFQEAMRKKEAGLEDQLKALKQQLEAANALNEQLNQQLNEARLAHGAPRSSGAQPGTGTGTAQNSRFKDRPWRKQSGDTNTKLALNQSFGSSGPISEEGSGDTRGFTDEEGDVSPRLVKRLPVKKSNPRPLGQKQAGMKDRRPLADKSWNRSFGSTGGSPGTISEEESTEVKSSAEDGDEEEVKVKTPMKWSTSNAVAPQRRPGQPGKPATGQAGKAVAAALARKEKTKERQTSKMVMNKLLSKYDDAEAKKQSLLNAKPQATKTPTKTGQKLAEAKKKEDEQRKENMRTQQRASAMQKSVAIRASSMAIKLPQTTPAKLGSKLGSKAAASKAPTPEQKHKEERRSTTKQMQAVGTMVEKLKKESRDSHAEQEKLAETLSTLTEELASVEGSAADPNQAETAQLKEEIANMNERMAEHGERGKMSRSRLWRALWQKAVMKALMDQRSGVVSEAMRLRAQQCMDAQASSLQKEIFEATVSSLHKANEATKGELAESRKKAGLMKMQMSVRSAMARKQKTDLETTQHVLERLQDQALLTDRSLHVTRRRLEEAELQIEAKEAEAASRESELQLHIAELQTAILTQQQAKEEALAAVERHEVAAAATEALLAELKEEALRLSAENDGYLDEIEQLEGVRDDLEAAKADLERAKAGEEAHNEQLRGFLEERDQDVELLRRDILDMVREKEMLTVEKRKLQRELTTTNVRLDKCEEDLSNAEGANQDLENEVDKLKEQLFNANTDRDEWKEEAEVQRDQERWMQGRLVRVLKRLLEHEELYGTINAPLDEEIRAEVRALLHARGLQGVYDPDWKRILAQMDKAQEGAAGDGASRGQRRPHSSSASRQQLAGSHERRPFSSRAELPVPRFDVAQGVTLCTLCKRNIPSHSHLSGSQTFRGPTENQTLTRQFIHFTQENRPPPPSPSSNHWFPGASLRPTLSQPFHVRAAPAVVMASPRHAKNLVASS